MASKSAVQNVKSAVKAPPAVRSDQPQIPPTQDDFAAFSDEGSAEASGSEESSEVEDESTDEDADMDDYEEPDPPKDDAELELEKLVFGDHAGFQDAVHAFGKDAKAGQGDDTTKAITAMPNDDIFYIDTGPGTAQPPGGLNEDAADVAPPAWEDSDDERMTVSLMAVPQLRKLRTFEGEDVISGTEYIRRLRTQYEALHPRPAWANWKREGPPSKRRRLSNESEGEDSEDAGDSNEDMSVDEDQPASQTPLAKLLRDSAPLTRAPGDSSQPDRPPPLKPEVITVIRHPDIQPTQPHSINCLSIHPTLPLLLSAGLSSTMYLHRIQLNPVPPDPPNPLLTSLHLRHTPLTTAAFSPGADGPSDPKIYLSGPQRYFHTWTLPSGSISKTTRIYGEQSTTQQKCHTLVPSPCGRYLALQGTSRKGAGAINILSAQTTQWQAQARAEGRHGIAAFAWWADGEGLTIATKNGEVTEYSMRTRAVALRWADPGATGITTLALTPDAAAPFARLARKARARAAARATLPDGTYIGPDRFVALGSASGVVTLYDRRALAPAPAKGPATAGADADVGTGAGVSAPATWLAPPPVRTLAQLTTPISGLAASPCGGLLVMASRWKRDALRLVHLPTGAVYRNWPTAKTPLGRVAGVAVGEVYDGERAARVLVVGGENGALRVWELGG